MKPYYEDDRVTLYHGDCLEITEWLSADVLITDPPYGRAWRQGDLGGARNQASKYGIANDDDTMARDDALALWGDRPGIVFGDLMLSPPERNKLTCVYHKSHPTSGLRGAIAGVRRDAEAIYLTGKWPSGIGGRSSVFAARRAAAGAYGMVAEYGGHPHTKATDVMEELVMLSTGTVADPFAGSGSTLIAARNQGRKAIGVELEEQYCDLIARRLDQMCLDFGQEA
jgi:site-specific DNA-methyltransferase (adenine-specific)